MTQRFFQIAFTPTVSELQQETYGRSQAVASETLESDELRPREREFIALRDSFYLGSVGETGWPYVQHRGGPAGFLKVIDAHTLAFADFQGNRQLVTAANTRTDPRVSLFLMDYAGRRRLKILGRTTFVSAADDPELVAAVADPAYDAVIERVAKIHVEAYDWNCPQHITQRFSAAEVDAHVATLRKRIQELETFG